MELSWSVRSVVGEPVGCARTLGLDTSTVELECLTLEGDACDLPRRFPRWPCSQGTGATSFFIPEGTYQFRLKVRCADSTAADVRVPDPIVRDILLGEVAELNALLIEVETRPPAGGCVQ